VEDRAGIRTLVLIGERTPGEHPHISRLRFPGESSARVADIKEGDLVQCEATLTYRTWVAPDGNNHSEVTPVGLTCFRLYAQPDSIVDTHDYLALRGALCEYEMRANVVKMNLPLTGIGDKRRCEVRVSTTDKQGNKHYFNITCWREHADTAHHARPGDVMLVRVFARKRKVNDTWRDSIEATNIQLSPGRYAKTAPVQAAIPVPSAPARATIPSSKSVAVPAVGPVPRTVPQPQRPGFGVPPRQEISVSAPRPMPTPMPGMPRPPRPGQAAPVALKPADTYLLD